MDRIAIASHISTAAGKFLAVGESGRDDHNFSQMLTNFMGNTPAEITPALDTVSNLADNLSATADLWSDRSTGNLVSTLANTDIPVSEIRLTDSELQKVADSLRKDDLEAARRIEDLYGHPGGASVAEVVSTAANNIPAQMNDADLGRIESLANEIDGSGKLSEAILPELRNGNIDGAWSAINSAIKDHEGQLSINKDQLQSLGKALSLSKDSLKALEAAFGKKDSLSLDSAGLKKLLSPAAKELASKAKSRSTLADNLESAMKNVINDARKRMENEARASGRISRRNQNKQVRIEDSVKRNGFDRQSNHDDGKTAKKTNADQQLHAEKNTDDAIMQLAENRHGNDLNDRGQNNKKQNSFDTKKNTTDTLLTAASAKKNEKSGSAWESMLNKIGMNQTSGNFAHTAQMTNNAGAANRAFSAYSSEVLNQVQQGMLSAMADGTKHLELQLHPADLGTVNVMLSSKNGEVSAILKTDRPETASLLQNQLASLRAQLEEQGVKVSSVEVQTQLQENPDMAWQGLDQHNAAQEQQNRSLHLSRLHRLSRIGTLSGALEIETEISVSTRTTLPAEDGRLNLVA